MSGELKILKEALRDSKHLFQEPPIGSDIMMMELLDFKKFEQMIKMSRLLPEEVLKKILDMTKQFDGMLMQSTMILQSEQDIMRRMKHADMYRYLPSNFTDINKAATAFQQVLKALKYVEKMDYVKFYEEVLKIFSKYKKEFKRFGDIDPAPIFDATGNKNTFEPYTIFNADKIVMITGVWLNHNIKWSMEILSKMMGPEFMFENTAIEDLLFELKTIV
jgi:hypothetical protein